MLLNGNEVIENIDERNLSRELEIAKFRNYGRERFSDLIRYRISFEEFIRNTSNFYSIKLPLEISDYFIRADIAPYFIMSDATILKDVEELLLLKKNDYNFIANYREVKQFYYKWLIQKTPKEKLFFANSLINSVERNFAFQSFYNVFLYGIILTFDSNCYNPKRAIELFDRSIEIVNECNISPTIKNEVLYFINVYKGFTFLKEYEYLNSLETFKNSLKYNPNGVTAFFYCALSARYIDDFDLSYDYLRSIIEYDKTRFKFAINYNHLDLFNFFYKNAIFYHVFTENGFAQLLPDIDFMIRSLYSGEANSMEKTYSKLINLDNLRIKEFFTDEVVREIKFLKNALDQYKFKKTGLIRIVEQIFRDKLVTVIEYIRNLIETHYFEQIKEEINIFDRQIDQNKRQLVRIKHELEDANKKIRMNLDEAAKYLEETITERSTFLEQKIENLDKNPKFNASQVFYSSFVFTIVVSFIIMFVLGIITSISGFSDEIASTNLAIKTGLRWGGVTFVLGTFISIFTTFSSFWEKAAEKRRLVNQLNKVKESESMEREHIHEDSDRKAKIYEQKFKDRIKTQEKIIENFISEREQNYNHKYNLARKEIEEYITPLNELLESF
ncbi:MAG: hypothetical protein KDC88_02325 [Ignavibacteriae bacterium]|nr:hypothetical protein [Ignavibacteriota bacterium]MCB9206148.1 hypothetical protein [Ignavibacteriales bacterium]MCB9209421.1 hypothetical protein [Ignavibacteriales bacterium]MCB9258064.1 hypothetical protein [Ignavibacteriales bacterium]